MMKTHADLLNEAYDSTSDKHSGCTIGFYCIAGSIVIVIIILLYIFL